MKNVNSCHEKINHKTFELNWVFFINDSWEESPGSLSKWTRDSQSNNRGPKRVSCLKRALGIGVQLTNACTCPACTRP